MSHRRDEYGKLYDFVTSKKLRVKNIGGGLVSYKCFKVGSQFSWAGVVSFQYVLRFVPLEV